MAQKFQGGGHVATNPKIYATRVGAAFEQLDLDHDGLLDRNEYTIVADRAARKANLATHVVQEVVDLFNRLFDMCDIDKDHHLSEKEYDYAGYLAKIAQFKYATRSANYRPPSAPGHEFNLPQAAAALSVIDVNNDRQVDQREFSDALEAFGETASTWGIEGVEGNEPTSSWALAFNNADMDGDGVLGLREFQYAGFLIKHVIIEGVLDAVFRDVDLDKDGDCSLEEMFRPTEADEFPFTPVVRKHFSVADFNKDERLQRGEVVRLLDSIMADTMGTSLF